MLVGGLGVNTILVLLSSPGRGIPAPCFLLCSFNIEINIHNTYVFFMDFIVFHWFSCNFMDFHIFIHIFTNFHRCLHILPHNQRIHTLIALLIYKLSCKQTSSLNKTENTSSLVLARNSFPRLNLYLFSFPVEKWYYFGLSKGGQVVTPNLPTNIVPTNIARVKLSGEIPRKSLWAGEFQPLKLRLCSSQTLWDRNS